MQTSDASRRENAGVCLSAVMPRFMRGIQYAAAYPLKYKRLWNTGLPGHPRSGRGQAPGNDTGVSGCLKIESWNSMCGRAHQAVIHRKNASSLMMMRANPKFDHKTAMTIASA